MAEVFDPNTKEDGSTAKGAVRFPRSPFPVGDAQGYVQTLADLVRNPQPASEIGKAVQWFNTEIIAKGAMAPPSTYSFNNAQIMPDQTGSSGVIPWPGLDPSVLFKIVQENIAPQMVIGMRIDDVMRYSRYTSYPWRTGWRLELAEGFKTPTAQDAEDMIVARRFIENCGDYSELDARDRDEAEIMDFQHFLTKITRDSYTYDAIAVNTDFTAGTEKKLKSFKALPAGNIRLVNRAIGYMGDRSVFAVLLDQVGSVAQVPMPEGNHQPVAFNRDELVWYVRNSRTDLGVYDYGWPEIEQCLKLIMAFSNILELLGDQFTKNAIPNGILLLKGPSWTQKQIDMVQRVMENLLKGITKRWALPILATPDESSVEMMRLNDLKDTDGRFNAFLNQSIGGICAIFRFPVKRFGYFASGEAHDNPRATSDGAGVGLVDDEDPGLAPLLTHIENLINQYLLTPNYPRLRFAFTAKSPKETAREYQSRTDAMTLGEQRELVDLPTYAKTYEKALKQFGIDVNDADEEEMKKMLALISMTPLNPVAAASFQTILANVLKAGEKEAALTEANNPGQKDPAASENKGVTGGVRRNSAGEKRK